MPVFRLGQAAELLGVSVDTLRRWADEGRVRVTRTDGGQRVVDGADLARFASEIARDQPGGDDQEVIVGRSARNHFAGLVTRVLADAVVAQVEIQAGPHRVVSLMTREAVDELGLEPGVLAVATVKATNVVVELPRAR